MRRVHLSEHDGDPGRATRARSGPRSGPDIYAASTATGAAGNAALHASSAVTATGATADAFVYATAAASAATGPGKAHPGAARQSAIAGRQYALGQPDLQQWRAN